MKRAFLLFLILISAFCHSQQPFKEIKSSAEQQVRYSDYKSAIELINNNYSRFNDTQKTDLNNIKIDALVNLEFLDVALELSQENLDRDLTPEQEFKTRIQRALIFEITEKDENCEKELNRCEKILDSNPSLKPKNYTSFLIRKSSFYRVNGFKEKAFDFALQAKDYGEKVNDEFSLSSAYMLVAFCYAAEQPLNTEYFYQRALSLVKKYRNYTTVESMYGNFAEYYIGRKDFKTAKMYADSGLSISPKSNVLSGKSSLYLMKSKIFEKMNDSDSALHYYKLYNSVHEQSLNERRDLKISELDYDYNLKKEKLQKKQLETQILATQRYNSILIVSSVVLTVLLALLGIQFLLLKKRKEKIEIQKENIAVQKEDLEKNLEQKKFLVKELNHRVKNNLAVILSLVDFHKDESQNTVDREKFKKLHERVQTISLAHELYSYNINTSDSSHIKIRDYTDKILETHKVTSSRKMEYENLTEDIELAVDKALPIGLMLNELITNALKHSNAPFLKLNFSLTKTDGGFTLKFGDNGTDFYENPETNSLGLTIIEGMTQQLSGSLERNGSSYTINFPE